MDKEKLIFRDCYNHLDKYIKDRITKQKWECIVEEANEIVNRHDSKLCRGIMSAILDHMGKFVIDGGSNDC